MGKFNFEDYRQPWETGPHWELKKEFMEKYSDMFSEDRLLCLAQAYSNVVLMHCSYPEPVMRQISHLSQPLKMRKRFQESNGAEGQQENVAGKRKYVNEGSAKSCKFIKFCAGEKESASPISLVSTVLHDNALKHPTQGLPDDLSTSDKLLSASQQIDLVSNMSDECQNKISDLNSCVEAEQLVQNNEIVSTLGLAFIQNFVQEVRKFQVKAPVASESIMSAAQKLKIVNDVCFKINPVPNCPPHAPLFCSELTIKGCLICSEQERSKKKAKAKCAETALDILFELSNVNITLSSKKKTVPGSDLFSRDSSINKQSVEVQYEDSQNTEFVKNSVGKSPSSNIVSDDMKMLQSFSEILVGTKNEELGKFLHIAKSLKCESDVQFNFSIHSNSLQEHEFICKFFLRNILIAVGKDSDKKSAKDLAVKSAFQKLKNLSQYEILNSELIERQVNSINKPSNSNSFDSTVTSTCDFQKSTFILNQVMFDESIRDGFVLLDNFSLHSVTQRNTRAMLSASASFSRKHFEYKFEEILNSCPPLKKVSVIIGEETVATATASSKDQAKIIACDLAIESLKKKYYTLKVKTEYNEGYIINRNQVFEGESFSSNALTENNIGCKMLKSMGWTGGALGTSGIVEPIEAQGHHSLGRGLGYSGGKNDLALFKKRIDSMLQDYSKTNTLSSLVFSKEFTKGERKEIHRLAQKYGLHTASYGANDNRFLTVRHKCTVTQILQYLAKNGGSNSKFELVDATNKSFECV